MPNHVHPILVPRDSGGIGRAMSAVNALTDSVVRFAAQATLFLALGAFRGQLVCGVQRS